MTQLFGRIRTNAGGLMGDEQHDASMESVCTTMRRAADAEGILDGFHVV